MMQRMTYRIRFLTPAFLGNAEQSGQWRTPPFKALLRQWWRVVWAERHGFQIDVAAMRRDEGQLFGNAWLDSDFRKSAVRIRLSAWDIGQATSWKGIEGQAVFHPEVQQTRYKIGPHAYLGYGPLDARGGTKFAEKVSAAIQAGEQAKLSLAAPAKHMSDILSSLALIDAYGAAGGRSRNGWGSISLDPADGSPTLKSHLASWFRPWEVALELDWPHAIGKDGDGPLVWRTAESYADWKALMRDLAILKIGFRTMFLFPPNTRPPHPRPLDRHWLSYPITRHETRQWSRNARLPNSLRFKVRPDPDDPKRLRGVVFHVPCLPPEEFGPDNRTLRNVWGTAHRLLDELTHRPARRRYEMIDNGGRREKLKPSLDNLTLERSPE